MFCEFFMYFFVFASYVFYCYFLYGIVWVLNINKYNSDFKCNKSKYCILELKMEFWHKQPFSICFVHKSRKFSNFEPTLDYIMLRNFGIVRPIFPKIAPKVAQDFKEKSREKNFHEIIARNVEGGGGRIPPPPPALLGLRVLRNNVCLLCLSFKGLCVEECAFWQRAGPTPWPALEISQDRHHAHIQRPKNEAGSWAV